MAAFGVVLEHAAVVALAAVASLLATVALNIAYHNTAKRMYSKCAQRAVAAEPRAPHGLRCSRLFASRRMAVEHELARSDKGRTGSREMYVIAVLKKRLSREVVAYSLFYNNAIFLGLVVACSAFVLQKYSPYANYAWTMLSASGILAFVSTGSA